jgi:uncharacterized protein (DUF983 family)
MKKRSILSSIFSIKCPSCREGDMFDGTAYNMKLKSFDMNKHCPKCRVDLEPEPGFYFGAMFISYGITGWFSIFFVIFFHWYLHLGLYTSFAILITFLTLNFIWIYRVSRCIWAHIAIKYGTHKVLSN